MELASVQWEIPHLSVFLFFSVKKKKKILKRTGYVSLLFPLQPSGISYMIWPQNNIVLIFFRLH